MYMEVKTACFFLSFTTAGSSTSHTHTVCACVYICLRWWYFIERRIAMRDEFYCSYALNEILGLVKQSILWAKIFASAWKIDNLSSMTDNILQNCLNFQPYCSLSVTLFKNSLKYINMGFFFSGRKNLRKNSVVKL